MKAKTYRFIFSILLICFAAIGKAQTIDGKLYTPFNNYYQWIGGKFNSNLNIPKITATTGRDTGGIRYNLIDSSVYVWTGSQWRQVGGATITASNGLTKTGDNVKLGGTLTENTTIKGVNRNLTFDTINQFIIKTKDNNINFAIGENIGANISDSYYGGSLSNSGSANVEILADSNTTQNTINLLTIKNVSKSSQFIIGSDSIVINPYQGIINIDTLATTSDTSTHKPIVYDVSTGRMKYKTAWQQTDTATVVKAYVTNAEAVTITKGQVVYIFGASGDRASVKLAKNTSDTFSSKTLGIVRSDIAAGQAGWITTQGQVSGINLGAYTAGDILWLDSVAGGFTKVKPVAPKHGVFVGVVERANAGNGLIYVKPQNGVELDELHNVKITSETNNQVLAYTASTGIWENKSVATALGYTPLDSVLNIAGSGVALVKGNDQIKRLKAGSGISITDNTDSVTIATSGVVWDGIDSSFASDQARRGRHEIEEFTATSSSASNLNTQSGVGTYSFRQSGGAFTGFYDDNTQGIRMTVTNSGNIAFIFNGPAPTTEFLNVLQLSSDWTVWTARIRIPNIADATDRYSLRFGIESGLNNANIVTGMAFVYDLYGSQTGSSASANWQTVTSKTNTRTYNQNSSNVAVSANTWIILKIIANSSNVYFYINNTLIGTHTTNLPTTTNIYPLFDFRKTLGSTARTCEIDYSTIDIKYSTPR